jgi:two-component system, OmpR family, phosphate regulon sensor histidine kinase PhoR
MRARLLILFAAAGLAAVPALVLAWSADDAPVPALFAAGAVAAVVLGIVARPIADIGLLGRLLEAVAGGRRVTPPQFGWLFRRLRLDQSVRRLIERWQAEQQDALHRQSRAEAALDALPDPVIVLDGESRVTRANRAARALLGDGAVGRELTSLLRQPELHEAIEAVKAGGGEASAEIRQATPVERNFVCYVSRSALAGADEMLVVLRDITEIKRTDEMRSDFVANASHEIRTPLATIAGCVETLLGPARGDPEAQQRFLVIMQQQSERMTQLVEDLLSLSRIELTEHQAPRGRVQVPELLRQVLDELTPTARAAGIELALELEDGLPPVGGDHEELEQVFHNLIDNAIKYGASGGRVEVIAGARQPANDAAGMVAVAVRDWGPGIAAEHRPRLTERFYRVDKARSRALGGTGLGLAIVKHIVNRHRGQLAVESELGAGSTFTVHLPAAPVTKA